MTKQKIIEKIKIAEEISNASKQFPKLTYEVVLSSLLSIGNNVEKEINFNVKKDISSKKRKTKKLNIIKKSNKGLSQKINDLINEDFFEKAKTSKEIIEELKLLGYTMKTTSLPSYLLPKIRNGELTREEIETKNGKIYGYIRKDK